MWTRCFPVYLKLKELLASGAIGDIRAIGVTFGVDIADVPRVHEKSLGGGSVLDLGVYTINFANFIFKEAPIQIQASGHLFDSGRLFCIYMI